MLIQSRPFVMVCTMEATVRGDSARSGCCDLRLVGALGTARLGSRGEMNDRPAIWSGTSDTAS